MIQDKTEKLSSPGEECVEQGRKSGARFSGAFTADGDGELLVLHDDGDGDDIGDDDGGDDVDGVLADYSVLGLGSCFSLSC